MGKGTGQFCRSAGRCGAMRRGVHAGMPLGCPLPAQCTQPPMGMLPRPGRAAGKAKAAPMGRQPRPGRAAGKAKAAPHGQAAKARACSRQGQGSPPWARSQGQGVQQARPRQPPMGAQARPGHAAAKAKARMHAAAKALACLRGHAGRPLGAGSRAIACTRACLGGSGSTAWARGHAPWVGCQGRGMPQGPLKGHGSTWGGCCSKAKVTSSDPSYSSPPKERLGKNQLWHEETLIC
ncbi:hypothetical protein CMV_022461 [Castanea mollissima]|uniref:Uncharacterized protein n=1 Tax=Castanea mollissima TaxID=60419 RepID=A0A8J4VBL1_9ROSI|nr:hypothetical protein CMV_022461 [Castanea mollissima]